MSSILDRLNQEFETFGRKAQTALDEGRLQIEMLRLRRKRDTTAADLGRLYHKRERGGDVPQGRIDGLLIRMDDIDGAIRKTEIQVGTVKAEAETVETPSAGSEERHAGFDESTQATGSTSPPPDPASPTP